MIHANDLLTKKGVKWRGKRMSVGYHWLSDFLKRHKDLRVRQSQVLSERRARAMDPDKITDYYEFLRDLRKKKDYKSEWSGDESGYSAKELEKGVGGKVVGQDGNITLPEWQVQLCSLSSPVKHDTTHAITTPTMHFNAQSVCVCVCFRGTCR